MSRTPGRISHLVQVARLRIETTIVEIEGDDVGDDEAMAEPIEEAEHLADEVWTMEPYDRECYRPHVQSIIAREEFEELAEHGATRRADAWVDARDHTRYLLLMANCGTAEGELILQPWLVTDQPDLLASELCREWLGSLEGLGLTHMAERLDELAAGSQPLPSDQVMFGVKQPRKPRP